MKLTELIGKRVIRIAPHGTTGDRSYMTEPIRILHADNENAVYKHEGGFMENIIGDKTCILESDYMDDNWRDYDELISKGETLKNNEL